MLDALDEGMICHTLRSRFAQDAFYTSVGTNPRPRPNPHPHPRPRPRPRPRPQPRPRPRQVGTILVAINPFQHLPIYGGSTMLEYHRPGNRQLPPHVFAVAAAAHKDMALAGVDQACMPTARRE